MTYPPQQEEVAYLTYSPGLLSPWVISLDRPFRLQGFVLWGWHPLRSIIHSVLLAGEEQLTQPAPASLWDAKLPLAEFLAKALREPVAPEWPRKTLRGVPLSARYPVARLVAGQVLDFFPSVNRGAEIAIGFTGELTSIALLGVQLL